MAEEKLLYFVWEILGLGHIERTLMQKGREIKRPLLDPRYHGKICRILDSNEGQVLMQPRGHLKSMMLKAKCMQMLLKDPMSRAVIYSKTATLARKALEEIKQMFKLPLITVLWDWVPSPGPKERNWKDSTKDYLTLAWPDGLGAPPQGRQIEVFGLGGSDTGFHYDRAFVDDPIDDQTVRTQDQIEKVDTFWALTKPKMEPGAPIYVAGTFYHYQDTYARMRSEYGDRFHSDGIDFSDPKPIYSFFTAASLKRLKDDMYNATGSHYAFACQYCLDTTPREEQIFPEPYQMYGPSHHISGLPSDDYIWRAAIDPAQTTEVYSDFSALTITATDKKKNVWVVEAKQIKKDPNASAEEIIEICSRYPIKALAVEAGTTSAYITVLKYKQREWENTHREKLKWAWIELKASNKRRKYDRINLTLGVLVRDRKVWIHQDHRDLVLQMSLFNPHYKGHDDLIDSLSMHYMMIDDFKSDYWTKNQSGSKPQMTIFNIVRQAMKQQKVQTWEGHFVDSAS
jgi:hypothetical protein